MWELNKEGAPGKNPLGRRGERKRVESDERGRGPQRGPEPEHVKPTEERPCQVKGEGHEQRTGAEGGTCKRSELLR